MRRPRRICTLESVFLPLCNRYLLFPLLPLGVLWFHVSISTIAHICLVFILRLSNLVLFLEKFLGFRISSLFLANKMDLFRLPVAAIGGRVFVSAQAWKGGRLKSSYRILVAQARK